MEVDFGRWDGQPWSAIPEAEVAAWADDLLHHTPGGGESLAALALRAHAFAREAMNDPARLRLVVGHGGWINALRHVSAETAASPTATVRASDWPAPSPHARLVRWHPESGPG
jgi:alpha-ribazole phosphatase